jgi:hypothetical protein
LSRGITVSAQPGICAPQKCAVRVVLKPRKALKKKIGEERNKETIEYARKNYPAMRELMDQYLMREITVK